MKELKIMYRCNRPYGIRDKGGLLLLFPNITKYDGQEERYREEIEEQFKLADKLLKFLKEKDTP